jgi:hypothetical protein
MDWLSALCLSVPPAAGLVVATWRLGREARSAAIAHAQNVNDGLVAVASRVTGSIDEATGLGSILARKARDRSRAAEQYARKTALLVAKVQAAAAVKCARYGAKAIVPRPPKESGKPPTAFEKWLATDGKNLPESVRDRVDWAVGRLRGDEDESQGDDDDAVMVLDQFAPGLAESTKDEVRRAIGAK